MSVSTGGPGADSAPGIVVVDIDGVIADVRHRLHFLRGRQRDWDGFFGAAPDDPPLAEGRSEIERALAEGLGIVYLTGRPERCRGATQGWLADHGFPDAPLVMRSERDRRPARTFKVEALRELALSDRIARVLDDDAAVVRAVSEAGFPVVHAGWMSDAPAEQLLLEVQEGEGRT